jgi:hypothetical protein
MAGHIFPVPTGAKNVAHCANCSNSVNTRFKIPPFNYYQNWHQTGLPVPSIDLYQPSARFDHPGKNIGIA